MTTCTQQLPSMRQARHRSDYLDQASIRGLIESYQSSGCRASLNKLLLNFSDMCLSIAGRYRSRFEADDIYQQCMESLIKAAKSFKLDGEHEFSGFAYCVALREISLNCIQQWNIVTPPKTKSYYKAFRKVSKLAGAAPMTQQKAQEMAREHGVQVEDILAAYALLTRSPSLDATADGGGSLADILFDPADTEQMVIDSNEAEVRNAALNQALEHLTPRQRSVVDLRLLCEHEDRKTLQEVGQMLGVSYERARQIEAESIRKLQKAAA